MLFYSFILIYLKCIEKKKIRIRREKKEIRQEKAIYIRKNIYSESVRGEVKPFMVICWSQFIKYKIKSQF